MTQIIRHERYVDFENYDIALLRLDKPATLNARVKLIPLTISPQDNALVVPSTLATITGWGETNTNTNAGDRLQQVSIPIVSHEICNDSMGGITANQLCAGYAEGGKDACQGDSGGPLMIPNGTKGWKLAGIVSYGNGCAKPNNYGVYTRVSQFINWMYQHGVLYKLQTTVTGQGTITSSPVGIRCGADCQEIDAFGTTFTLTAQATPGSIFAGWSGACRGTSPTCVVTLTNHASVTANFQPHTFTPNNSIYLPHTSK